MRTTRLATRFLLILMLAAIPAKADQTKTTIGNDTYLSGSSAVLSDPSPRDAFVWGFNVDVKARVDKDVHAAGFNVTLDAPVGSDAYAAGFSVEVTQPIESDLTASAYSIHVSEAAAVAGNARLAARTMVLDGPVAGSLVAAAGDLTVNGVISGDAVLTVGTLKFGTNAKINGKLKYYAREPITIPASVVSADRIEFEKLNVGNTEQAMRDTANRSLTNVWPSYVGILTGFAMLIAFLVAMGAVLLAFAPRWMEDSKNEALHSPVKIMALGVLGLSLVTGLVPVSGMTLIGIPLIPLALLAAMGLWIVGYILGAYAIGAKVGPASSADSASMGSKVAVLAATLVILSLLNFIPIIGWLVNLAVVFLGLGTILMRMARYITREEPHVADTSASTPVAGSAATTVSVRKPRTSK